MSDRGVVVSWKEALTVKVLAKNLGYHVMMKAVWAIFRSWVNVLGMLDFEIG